jgi:uncharacterized protein (UPF0261 family)
MVVHSVVDILGINPISRAVFDNVAAALAGMATHRAPMRLDDGQRRVAITMLGNTTKAVMLIRDRLAADDIEAVIFHSNGVGGPAMEELAADGLFAGVIDFTTDELTDELVGGFHAAGPDRLRVIGRLDLPQVVVPGCIDFWHGRPGCAGGPAGRYAHNPVHARARCPGDGRAQTALLGAPEQATGPWP